MLPPRATRLRPRIASSPPVAAAVSHAARPSATSSSRPCARRNSLCDWTQARLAHHRELIDGDLAGDVLAAEIDKRVRSRGVTSVGPQPLSPRALRHRVRRGRVVEHDHALRHLEGVAQPLHRVTLPRDPGADLQRAVQARRRPPASNTSTSRLPSAPTHTSAHPSSARSSSRTGRLSSSSFASTTCAAAHGRQRVEAHRDRPHWRGCRQRFVCLVLRRRDARGEGVRR